jgi:hypothetical protein
MVASEAPEIGARGHVIFLLDNRLMETGLQMSMF